MSSYIKNIVLVMALLSMAAAALAQKLDLYPWTLGVGVAIFMGLNALGAVYPLYKFPRHNPFNIYIGSMVVRLGIIGCALILVMTLSDLSMPSLLSMTITAMGCFIAYLAIEVRHFLNHTAFVAPGRTLSQTPSTTSL